MTTIYLISTTDFQRRANVSQNINTNRLKESIGIVQEMYGKKLLCVDLYDEIISEYPDSLSVANTALLPYIQDFLIYKSYSRYLETANVLMTPAGARTQIDDTSSIVSDEQMKILIRQADNDANYYQDQLINFLIKNEDTYTLWKDSICNCNDNRRPVNLNRYSKVGTSVSYSPIKWT